MQCAAVRTYLSLIMAPPQNWLRSPSSSIYIIAAIHGYLLIGVSSPFTILKSSKDTPHWQEESCFVISVSLFNFLSFLDFFSLGRYQLEFHLEENLVWTIHFKSNYSFSFPFLLFLLWEVGFEFFLDVFIKDISQSNRYNRNVNNFMVLNSQ